MANNNYQIERTSAGLFEHLCNQMELLSNHKISLDEAKEQGGLVKQANNVLRYELDVKKFESQKNERILIMNGSTNES